MVEINCSNEFYSDLFSLQFDNLLQSLNLYLDGMKAVVNQENWSSNTDEMRASERMNEFPSRKNKTKTYWTYRITYRNFRRCVKKILSQGPKARRHRI